MKKQNSLYDVLKGMFLSTTGVIGVVLLVLSIVLLSIACSDVGIGFMSDRATDNVNNILFGIGTNLIGIIISVSFIQYIIEKRDERVEQEEEIEKILRYDRTMNILYSRYLDMYGAVTTRLKDRGNISAVY